MSPNKPLSERIWNPKFWLLLGGTGFILFAGFFVYLMTKEKSAGFEVLPELPSHVRESAVSGATGAAVVKSTTPVTAEVSMMLIKEGKFDSVLEPPKPIMDVLQEMSGGGKKKKPVVFMNDRDLGKTVNMPAFSAKGETAAARGVPSPSGNVADEGHIVMPKAPVDFKVFLDPRAWNGFTSSHRGRYPSVDFSRQMVVMLVSLSEFPSGIFEIVKAAREKDRILIQYRVNPFAMSAENPDAAPDAYSAAAVDRADLPIELEQVR